MIKKEEKETKEEDGQRWRWQSWRWWRHCGGDIVTKEGRQPMTKGRGGRRGGGGEEDEKKKEKIGEKGTRKPNHDICRWNLSIDNCWWILVVGNYRQIVTATFFVIDNY